MKNFASTTALIAVCLLISSPTWAQSPKLGVRCKLGVLVLGVDAESPAQKAGIKALDYIVACDEQAVASFQDMRGWLDGVAGGETHAIRVSRGNEEVVTSVHFPKTASGDVVLGVSLN
ncbi:MAG: PDZ domain-containing protein, partial [Planctomycetes bacterium]|nr:PDZ domain-containing protein [Planctomycetota bacterium]